MNSFAAQSLVECLGWTLLHFLWQGVIIAALLAVILRCCHRALANIRYTFGCVALLLIATAPVATFSLIYGGAKLSPARIIVERDLPTLRGTAGFEISPPALSPIKILPPIHLDWSERLAKVLPLLVILWVLGVLVFSLRLAAAWVRVNLLKRRFASPCAQPWQDKVVELSRRLGVRRSVRLLQSALVEVPAVIGWLRPVILLPASSLIGLSPAQLEAILAHELAHIRRHDYLVNLCQTILETILFYHPAVWWISRQVRVEREHCCDDLAVGICGDRLDYARALATLEELRQPPAQLALAASGAPLLPRIQRLLALPPANPARPAWPFAGIVILALLTLVAVGLRGGHAQAEVGQAVWEPNPLMRINNLAPVNTSMVETPGIMIPSELSGGRIHQLLADIRLETLAMHSVPLPDVIKQLNDEARSHDLAHHGIHFALSPEHAPAPRPANQRQEMSLVNPELYLGFVTINFPERKDVSFADALDLIALHADFPIQYAIFKDRVVFMKADVETKTFHLAGTAFNDQLKKNPGAPQDGSSEPILYRPPALQKLFSDNDVNLITNSYGATPEASIWNYHTGDLNVRATPLKLAKIEIALSQLASANPQSNHARVPTVRTNSAFQISPLSSGHLALEIRTFYLTNNFLATLKNSHGAPLMDEVPGGKMPMVLWQFFRDVGVDLDTNNPANIGKAFAWNERKSHLLVRATSYDLRQIKGGIGMVQFVSEHPNPNLSYHIYRVNSDIFRAPAGTHDDSAWKEFNALRQHLASVGVASSIIGSLVLGETCFTDPPQGLLMFRGTPADLDAINAGISRLTKHSPHFISKMNRLAASKPEINIKIKIVAVGEEKAHKLGIDWLFPENELSHRETSAPIEAIRDFPSATNSISSAAHPVSNSIISQITGVLAASDYKTCMATLENTFHVDIFSLPEVTTELGRPYEVMAADEFTVVTGATTNTSGKNPTTSFSTENLSFGPILKVMPKLNDADGSIDLHVTASIGEFAGYANSIKTAQWSPKYLSYDKPHPQFHLRQMRTEKSVQNGDTLVLAGLSAPETNVSKGKSPLLGHSIQSPTVTKMKRNLVIFITPTLINPDGTLWTDTAK